VAQTAALTPARSVDYWLSWFLGTLRRAINSAQTTLDTVLVKARFWQRWAGTPLNERQVKLLNHLLDSFEGKLTSSKWAAITKCSPDTALRDINCSQLGVFISTSRKLGFPRFFVCQRAGFMLRVARQAGLNVAHVRLRKAPQFAAPHSVHAPRSGVSPAASLRESRQALVFIALCASGTEPADGQGKEPSCLSCHPSAVIAAPAAGC